MKLSALIHMLRLYEIKDSDPDVRIDLAIDQLGSWELEPISILDFRGDLLITTKIAESSTWKLA